MNATRQFHKILIANRGEIAVRIIRACRELGISSVAVYSDVDREAMHVHLADEAYCIGAAPPADSYLNMTAILSVATSAQVDAIHPGYGFLAENADFAELCESIGIVFIGPPSSAIARMGDKSSAKQTMKQAGVPVVPGSEGIVQTVEEAIRLADEIGYPVMIKATAGGGGKGIRIVDSQQELVRQMASAQQEADRAFGNGGVYIEKYLTHMKHVEIQILADTYGNVIHLGERDCSIQRRRQKLVEEAPCPTLSEETRHQMGLAAIRAARHVGYTGAGTLEFLLGADERFYFMEMNTRIQVEHPVTEMVTQMDIIKEMIRVAAGHSLSKKQEDVNMSGCAIECRINAEDPDRQFMPSPGRIQMYLAPGGFGVRVDSAAFNEYVIPPHYDSMIAKLIVWGENREEAIARMERALEEYSVEGISTTIPFHLRLMRHPLFRAGKFDIKLLEEHELSSSSDSGT